MAVALGYESTVPGCWSPGKYRIVINTVPAPVLRSADCHPNALLLDLASTRGITGDGVNWALRLPGVCAPETTGRLIARTVLRLISEKEATI